jgi:hypothetical protein
VSALAAEPSSERASSAAALRRSRRIRLAAIVLVVVGALAAIVGPHFRDSTRISSVADRAAAEARGRQPAVSCPADPLGRGAVNPNGPVLLRAAVVCHYPPSSAGGLPAAGPVPASQLAGISADLNANSAMGSMSVAPGLGARDTGVESWVLVGVTSTHETIQLLGQPYPSMYVFDGLGPMLVWHPTPGTQRLLAGDLPR